MGKRLTALLLTAAMIFGMLSGCRSANTREETENTAPPAFTDPKEQKDPTIPSEAPTIPSEIPTEPENVTRPAGPKEDEKNPPREPELPEMPETPAPVYEVSFHTDGGTAFPVCSVDEGHKIGAFPTPYKENSIFMGWYYDPQHTRMALAEDTVTSNTDLYAGFQQAEKLEPQLSPQFASALDVAPDFKITVLSQNVQMTEEQIRKKIKVQNLADPDETDIISVTGSGGRYVVAATGGYEEGTSYRLTLLDEELSFEDFPVSARQYHFTTDKKEVLNVHLAENMLFIPAEEVSNIVNDGKHVDSLNLALYEVDGSGKVTAADLTRGSFTYAGSLPLKKGDVVTVYSGLRPDLRTLESTEKENGDLAYLKITDVNGSRITYENARPEEVIFQPDMLPVPVAADLDSSETTITVENRYLDYSDDIYAYVDLDSQTTVDVGDFLTFYTGTFGGDDNAVTGYGQVVKAEEKPDGTTVITYVQTDWETVQKAMDIYVSDPVEGNQMLEGVDKESLEASIEQQALDSGFAEEAAMYLASLAMATEGFTQLKDHMNLSDYKVTLEDGMPLGPEQIQLMTVPGSGVQVEMSKCAAHISTKLQNFEEYSGLRLTLEVGVDIIITPQEGSDNQIVITVSGNFEQEVRLSLNVSSQAIWKVWGIFPYIAEFRVTANVDMFDFTGIGVDASYVTREKDQTGNWTEDLEFNDLAMQIKDLLKKKDIYTSAGDVSIADTLSDKYQAMLESESDWVEIVNQPLAELEFHVPPMLPIIALNLKIDFVVSVDSSVSLGMDFYYKNAKRYVYAVDVFSRQVHNDVIDICRETYEFTFYAVGRLGIRAGIRAEFAVGLFSTDLGSLGFVAETGAYSKLWGYFYYELHYTAGENRSQSCSGAMYMETGAYLEIAFKAQAFSELLCKEISLYEEEWPFFSAGRLDHIKEFSVPQQDMPEIQLKQYIRSVELPQDIFSMHYLDLKDGCEKDRVYQDSEENYSIIMTNDAFSYDPKTNTITVKPNADSEKETGKMIITWINLPLAFSSRPIRRTVNLYWDNLRDGYVIVPYTGGGSYTPIINQKFATSIHAPADPQKAGFVFSGWYEDSNFTKAYQFPETMPGADTSIYAKWVPASNTPYTVQHFLQRLGSSQYDLADTEHFTGTTFQKVKPETRLYKGFASPAREEVTIAPDGSTLLRYYYDRNTYTVTFDYGTVAAEPTVLQLKYGGSVSVPHLVVPGYEFLGWNQEVASVMGDSNVTYVAQWGKSADTPYRVEFYVQQPDGRYVMDTFLNQQGKTGQILTQEQLLNLGITEQDGSVQTALKHYTVEGGISFRNITVGGQDMKDRQIRVSASGKTVIKVNFQRHQHTLTIGLENGQADQRFTLFYGGKIDLPQNMKKTGYRFLQWKPAPEKTMGTEDARYQAEWTPIDYTVAFDQNLGTGTMAPQGFSYDAAQTLSPCTFTRTGYTFAGWAMTADGKVVYKDGASVLNLTNIPGDTLNLYAIWTPVKYTVTYEDGGIHHNPLSYTVEDENFLLQDPEERTGYRFGGWYGENSMETEITRLETRQAKNLTLYAKWLPNTCTLYFHGNEGSGSMDELILTYNQQRKLPLNTFTRTGRRFAGWARSAEGSVAFEDGETVQNLTAQHGADIHLYARWELVNYPICYYLNGGENSKTNPSSYQTVDTVMLQDAAKTGYQFRGWYENKDFAGEPLTEIPEGQARDITLYARWTPRTDTSYQIEHYQENLDGTFKKVETEHLTGTTDSTVIPEVKQYVGFTSPKMQSVRVTADGAQVVRYEYTRNTYQIHLHKNGAAQPDEMIEAKFGAPITLPVLTRNGYGFAGWYSAADFSGDAFNSAGMPADIPDLYAKWVAGEFGFQVNHYVENLSDGGYTLRESQQFTGNMDSRVTPDVMNYTGFASPAVKTLTIGSEAGANVVNYYYTRNYYQLSWNLNGGTAENIYTVSGSYPYETPITAPQLVKTGYGFTWDQTPASILGAGHLAYTAKWTANSYEVIFDGRNGSPGQTVSVTYDRFYPAVAAPEKPGYTFLGWYTEPEGGTEVTTSVRMQTASAHTLYAHWRINKYTITYEGMDGAAHTNPETYTVEDAVRLAAPVKTGCTFLGWTFAGQDTPLAQTEILKGTVGNRTYRAHFCINSHTLSWDLGGGQSDGEYTQGEVLYGTAITAPRNLTREGYTFSGWSGTVPASMPDENVMLTARWEAVQYPVTYHLNGGINPADAAESYTVEAGVLLPKPTRTGYTFCGWYEAADLSGKPEEQIVQGSTGSRAYFAKWRENSYIIRFQPDGGVGTMEDMSVFYTQSKSLTGVGFTRAGYSFAGWARTAAGAKAYEDGESITGLSAKDGDVIVLHALWHVNSYNISYDVGAGTMSSDAPNSFTAENREVYVPDPVRTGYTFDGWFKDSSLSQPIGTAEEGKTFITIDSTDHVTYFARWKANRYAVEFNDNLKSGISGVPESWDLAVYDRDLVLPGYGAISGMPENPGYTFVGWTAEPGGTEVQYPAGQTVRNLAPSGTVTLYAVWKIDTYTLSYNLGTGGTDHHNPGTYQVTTEDLTLQAPAAKADYQFLGWFDGDTQVTSIPKGSYGNRSLTARWAHGGTFSLTTSGAVSAAGATSTTYTVTRTLPAGTVATTDPQHVYYRTLNGTAYGGTAEIIHFQHAGGPDAYLVFRSGENVKTFTVRENGGKAGSGHPEAGFTTGLQRYYFAEIYQVESTAGNCTGKLDSNNARVTHKLAQDSDHVITSSFYNTWNGRPDPSGVRVIQAENRVSFGTINPDTFGLSQDLQNYLAGESLSYGYYLTLQGNEQGHNNTQYVTFTRKDSAGQTIQSQEQSFYLKNGVCNEWLNVRLPAKHNTWQGEVHLWNNKGPEYSVEEGGVRYYQMNRGDVMEISAATYDITYGDRYWEARNLVHHIRVTDTSEPVQLGLAAMAFGNYKTGDTIYMTVRYDEIVGSGTVSLPSVPGVSVSGWSYVDGIGTNALVFRGTLTADIQVTPDFNNTLMNAKSASGAVYDLAG